MDKKKILEIENIVWIIYLIFVPFGILANNLEIKDLENNNDNNRKKYKTINIIIFIIAILIYIFFVRILYKRYKEKRSISSFLNLLGSFFILIGAISLLIVEIFGDEVVPNE